MFLILGLINEIVILEYQGVLQVNILGEKKIKFENPCITCKCEFVCFNVVEKQKSFKDRLV